MNVMATIVPSSGAWPYRLNADSYLRAIDAGAFGEAHVELVDGELVETAEVYLDCAVPREGGVRRYPVNADDYDRMVDAGAFGNAHVELVDGVLIEMAPAHSEHSRMHGKIVARLTMVYPEDQFEIHIDVVTLFDDSNVRAPDVAVVDRAVGNRKQLVPSDILLAVEVSNSTLREDIGRKRVDYAIAGIRHYWVVDIEGRRTHCYADPLGADFSSINVVPFGKPVAVPGTGEAIVIA